MTGAQIGPKGNQAPKPAQAAPAAAGKPETPEKAPQAPGGIESPADASAKPAADQKPPEAPKAPEMPEKQEAPIEAPIPEYLSSAGWKIKDSKIVPKILYGMTKVGSGYIPVRVEINAGGEVRVMALPENMKVISAQRISDLMVQEV